MSKLAEHLTLSLDNRSLSYEMKPIAIMDVGMTIDDYSPTLGDIQTINVGVKLGVSAAINRRSMANNEFIVREMKMKIIEQLFGEFREDFMKVNSCLFERDIEGAMKTLSEFRTKMFEEGL